MFSASAPILPPPSTSLLPPLHERPGSQDPFGNSSNNASIQTRTNRNRGGHVHPHHPYHSLHYHHHSHLRTSPLALLSLDERTIAQRKLAIAMYGYSWLKPAGCNKTMLGRREEEIEREEVERQLREVEMQERNALEVEEQERRDRLEEQARRERQGETLDTTGEDGEGERDLDEEVPDMDALDEEDEGDGDEDEVDLDDEVPEADSNWAYETTRDPDTDSVEDNVDMQPPSQLHDPLRRGLSGIRSRNQVMSVEEQEQAEQEALINEMLDEDELGGMQRDLDDDLPDMDADMDMDMDMEGERDLDDDVPEADADEDGWEHTDTELEESEMDISILPAPTALGMTGRGAMLPPSSTSANRERRSQNRLRYSTASELSVDLSQGSASDMRRISGNMLPPPPVGAGGAASMSGIPSFPYPGMQTGPRNAAARGTGQPRRMIQTPGTAGSELSVSALISTGNSDTSDPATRDNGGPGNGRRGWLNPAGARRNLFGATRSTSSGASTATGIANGNPQTRSTSTSVPQGHGFQQIQTQGSTSSGGLFTPSPRNTQSSLPGEDQPSEEEDVATRGGLGMRTRDSLEPPSGTSTTTGRTRSGRGQGRTMDRRGRAVDDT